MKIPRCDMDEVEQDAVTVTSGLHAQAERTKKQNKEERDTSGGGSNQSPESGNVAQSLVRRLVIEGGLCRAQGSGK